MVSFCARGYQSLPKKVEVKTPTFNWLRDCSAWQFWRSKPAEGFLSPRTSCLNAARHFGAFNFTEKCPARRKGKVRFKIFIGRADKVKQLSSYVHSPSLHNKVSPSVVSKSHFEAVLWTLLNWFFLPSSSMQQGHMRAWTPSLVSS